MAHMTEHGRYYERLQENREKARKSGDAEQIAKAEAEYDAFMREMDEGRQRRASQGDPIESLERRVAEIERRLGITRSGTC